MAPHYHRTSQGVSYLFLYLEAACESGDSVNCISFLFCPPLFSLSTLLLTNRHETRRLAEVGSCSGAESLFFLAFVTVVLIMAEACKIDDGTFS